MTESSDRNVCFILFLCYLKYYILATVIWLLLIYPCVTFILILSVYFKRMSNSILEQNHFTFRLNILQRETCTSL